jgi:hypothetical protein
MSDISHQIYYGLKISALSHSPDEIGKNYQNSFWCIETW